MLQIGKSLIFEPGDLVQWHGWHAVVVSVDFEQRYQYRLRIEEVTGADFMVLALADEVKVRGVASRRYTSELAIALCEVEEEDKAMRNRDEREAEQGYALDVVRAALVQAERELRWMQSWWWFSLGIVSLVGFVCGYLTRR